MTDNSSIKGRAAGVSTTGQKSFQLREDELSPYRSLLRRFTIEILLEIGLVFFCLAWAMGWRTHLGLALSIMCFRFAIGDFATAFVVLRCDPDRWHGWGLAGLFVATGFFRASVAGAILMILSLLVTLFLGVRVAGRARPGVLLTIFGAGGLCCYGYLAMIFPPTLFALLISLATRTRLSFAMGMTKLRRKKPGSASQPELDVLTSIHRIGIASGVSLSMWVMSTSFLFEGRQKFGWILTLMAGAFAIPFVWFGLMDACLLPRQFEAAHRHDR